MDWIAKRSLPHPCLIYIPENEDDGTTTLSTTKFGGGVSITRTGVMLVCLLFLRSMSFTCKQEKVGEVHYGRDEIIHIARQFLSSLKMECMLILWEYSTWTFGGQSLSIAS